MSEKPSLKTLLESAIARSKGEPSSESGALGEGKEGNLVSALSDELEKENLRGQEQRHKIETLKEQNKDLEATRKLRVVFGHWTFGLITGWTFFLVVFVWMSGCKCSCFRLPDSVFIAYLTTTTVAVIGLPLAVLQGLFKTQDNSRPEKKGNQTG